MAEIDERSPYTPETLAERWDCSPRQVRDMCTKGQLAFFRLGLEPSSGSMKPKPRVALKNFTVPVVICVVLIK